VVARVMCADRIAPMQPPPAPLERPVSLTQLFVAFTTLALQGFGGVMAIAQRVLCEQRRWLTREQFVETLAVSQVLPGPNVVNMSLMIGDRFFGWRGAVVALAGMMTVPTVLVLALSALYMRFADVPAVAGALKGMGAVAAGMIVGTALRLVPVLRANPMGRTACAVIGIAAFVAIALLHWPLLWVLAVLGPAACVFAWGRLRPSTS
jgi:chromate transporter